MHSLYLCRLYWIVSIIFITRVQQHTPCHNLYNQNPPNEMNDLTWAYWLCCYTKTNYRIGWYKWSVVLFYIRMTSFVVSGKYHLSVGCYLLLVCVYANQEMDWIVRTSVIQTSTLQTAKYDGSRVSTQLKPLHKIVRAHFDDDDNKRERMNGKKIHRYSEKWDTTS